MDGVAGCGDGGGMMATAEVDFKPFLGKDLRLTRTGGPFRHFAGPTPITFTRCLPQSKATGVGNSYRPTLPALSAASSRR
jgi:hypothetical protein